ncbi:hypothetical protein KY290_035651 [Solanum tuberosum]|uniref:Uncharacterized protein n=1 Tax=Solanum tuberosum TaxID=4113 RepID=A0ABQ7TQS4_SOLTU|nr:hypothetical protein KY284_035003 [Solanum tuberosum]KAH0635249.1 hypothetical protein KY289_035164 [Solanum tuberosum]KAH0638360.1 hypothetical protein KY285_034946 [Solanum tuberosum]KAH0736946.1 hypothetical protein KY290_035651 [Solanum tuberosum]
MIYIPLVPITVNRFASLHNPGLLESICFWNEKLSSELRLLRERYVNILGFPFQNVDISSGLKDAKDDAGDPESRHKGMLETENLLQSAEFKFYEFHSFVMQRHLECLPVTTFGSLLALAIELLSEPLYIHVERSASSSGIALPFSSKHILHSSLSNLKLEIWECEWPFKIHLFIEGREY